MRPSRLPGLCAALLFAGSVAAAQAPAGRAAAKAAFDAACRAGDCYAVKVDEALDAREAFTKDDLARAESEWLCAEKHRACARVRRAYEGLVMMSRGLAECGQGECPPETLAAMCRGSVEATDYSAPDDADPMAGSYVGARARELIAPLEALVAKKLGPGLGESESALTGVDRALEGAAAGRADLESPGALSGRLESAQAQWRQASQAVNFCAAPTPSVERMNTVARGLSSARARLKALRVARGLADPGREATEAVFARGSGGAPAAPAAAVAPRGRGRSDVLALSSALQPPGKIAEPASLLIRGEGVPVPSAEEADELERIQRLRETGGTRLVGDPAGRAALIHEQTGQDCVIVSQQQILVMAGLVDNADPAAAEDALQREANAKGYHDQEWGTLPEHYGSLLMDRGFLVTRTDLAGVERLDAAVRTGRPVIVAVDGRRLWDQRAQDVLSHAIIITGAISDSSTGRILGYYVNDSSKPPAGARFISAAAFAEMWQAAGAKMTEVL